MDDHNLHTVTHLHGHVPRQPNTTQGIHNRLRIARIRVDRCRLAEIESDVRKKATMLLYPHGNPPRGEGRGDVGNMPSWKTRHALGSDLHAKDALVRAPAAGQIQMCDVPNVTRTPGDKTALAL